MGSYNIASVAVTWERTVSCVLVSWLALTLDTPCAITMVFLRIIAVVHDLPLEALVVDPQRLQAHPHRALQRPFTLYPSHAHPFVLAAGPSANCPE